MVQVVLLCLLILYGRCGGLSTAGPYNKTSEGYPLSSTSASLTPTSLWAEKRPQVGPQGSPTASTDGPPEQKNKTATYKILYITNHTSDFARRGPAPISSQSGFRWKSTLNNTPVQNFNSRSATNANFETSRGKNWCAYVHTRLSPTAVIDSAASYLPIGTYPCSWIPGGCPERYKVATRPTYKMKHKIVTSLEWRCCPGYRGHQCQLSNSPATPVLADEPGHQVPGDLSKEATLKQAQRTAVTVGMAEMKWQNESILRLEKQMADLSGDVKRTRTLTLSSNGNMRTQEREHLKLATETLKSKAIQKMFREIAREEIGASQNAMQENITTLYKIMSGFSQDLAATKANMEQINGRVTKLLSSLETNEEKNKQIALDIQSLKDQVSVVQDAKIIHAKDIAEMFQDELHLVQQNNISQITENQINSLDETLTTESSASEGQRNESKSHIHLMPLLHRVISKQALLIQQLLKKSKNQDIRIGNLSVLVGRQRHLADTALRQDILPLLEEIHSRISVVNESLGNRIRPVDIAVNVIEEKISHMSNELEELKPRREKPGLPGRNPNEENEISLVEIQLRGLADAVRFLNMSVINLEKSRDELRNHTWKEKTDVKDMFKEYQDEIEDVVNGTMTVMNKAMDSVKDDYDTLKDNLESISKRLGNISEDFTENIENLMNLKLHIDSLNTSVVSMQIKIQNSYTTSNESNMFMSADINAKESNGPENLTDLSHKLNYVFSKLENHQTAISRLQQSKSSFDFGEYSERLEGLEVRLNALSTNITSAIKPKKKPPVETSLALKYKDLNRRVQDLTAQTFNLSHEILWLKGSTLHEKESCKNLSTTLDEMQARIPQIFQEHIAVLQQNLSQFLQSDSQALKELVHGSNHTNNLGSTLAHIFQNISLLRMQAPELDKMLETALNATVPVGRNQRNTDIIAQEEAPSCRAAHCQNGGTCIDVRGGYVCACRSPFSGTNCTIKLENSEGPAPDFSKGSYRYAPMVTFFVAHTFAMQAPGPIRFNHLYVNYGASFSTGSGKFAIPYLGVYVFKYTVESSSPTLSGYLVVDEEDKLAFQAQDSANRSSGTCVAAGDAVLELNRGQRVWLRLENGAIPDKYPPVTTFGGYLLYRT